MAPSAHEYPPPDRALVPYLRADCEATVTVEQSGEETTRVESPCPACGAPRQTLLQVPRS